MSRKKAIERARENSRKEKGAAWLITEAQLSALYDEAMIAGARKAIGWLPNKGALRAWDTKRKLRARANALAKKARKR